MLAGREDRIEARRLHAGTKPCTCAIFCKHCILLHGDRNAVGDSCPSTPLPSARNKAVVAAHQQNLFYQGKYTGPEWCSGNVTALRRYSPGFESRRSQSGPDFGVEAPSPPPPPGNFTRQPAPWRRPRGVALDFVLNSLVDLINQLGGPQFKDEKI